MGNQQPSPNPVCSLGPMGMDAVQRLDVGRSRGQCAAPCGLRYSPISGEIPEYSC